MARLRRRQTLISGMDDGPDSMDAAEAAMIDRPPMAPKPKIEKATPAEIEGCLMMAVDSLARGRTSHEKQEAMSHIRDARSKLATM